MDTLNITLPTAWSELSQEQLRFVFRQLARDITAAQLKAICLLHWAHIKILARPSRHAAYIKAPSLLVRGKVGLLTARQLEAATHALDFLDTVPPTPVRLERVRKKFLRPPFFTRLSKVALTCDFQDIAFETYLYLDNLYQGYLHTKDESLLHQMAQVLYRSDYVKPTRAELLGVFYWWTSLKSMLAREFPHFLQPMADQEPPQNSSLLAPRPSLYSRLKESTNALIRALTGGDITKEATIKKMDTWRALTELDAKAKEAKELSRLYKK